MFPKSSLTFTQHQSLSGNATVVRAEITLSTQNAYSESELEESRRDNNLGAIKQALADQLNEYVFGKLRRAIWETRNAIIYEAGNQDNLNEIERVFDALADLTQPPTEAELDALGYTESPQEEPEA